MRNTLLTFVFVTGLAFGADHKTVVLPTFQYGPYTATIHDVRLNMAKHTLEVKGTLQLDKGKLKKFKYIIDPQAATMTQDKERRYFIPEEAEFLHSIYDWLITYSAESGVWWASGLGYDKPVPAAPSIDAPLPKKDKNIL